MKINDKKKDRKKNIFIITEYVFPYQNSTGYYWSKIINKLSQDNLHLTIICRKPEKVESEDYQNKGYYYIHEKSYEGKGVKQRLFAQIKITAKISIKLLKMVKRDDLVITGTNPVILLYLIPFLKKIFFFRWLLLVHDVFPNNLKPYNVLKNNNIYNMIDRTSNIIYTNADRIITIGRDMKALIESKNKKINNVSVIQNWANPKELNITEKNKNKIINKFGLENYIVFVFFGNIGRLQGINNILNAIKLTKNKKIAFLFIGQGEKVIDVQKFIRENKNIKICYHDSIPMKDKSIGLSACDVAIISLESQMLGVGVPSKAYFSMAADKPLFIIAEKDSEISKMVLEEGIGWHCKQDDTEKIANIFDNISEDEIKNLRGKPLKVIEEKYSEELALKKISSIISNII